MNIELLAEEFKVSKATIRNWIKLELLSEKDLSRENIIATRRKILSLSDKKLSSRANKIYSEKNFIPQEYITKKENIDLIENFLEKLNRLEFLSSIDEKIFLSTILYLKSQNYFEQSNRIIDILEFLKLAQTKQIYIELKNWQEEIRFKYQRAAEFLLKVEMPENNDEDFLGIVYQSLKEEGKKSQTGSYYTPQEIVIESIKDYIREEYKVLDPACGTGQYLLHFAKKIKKPELIYGFDIDSIAVKIARINLMLAYRKVEFVPNVFLLNTLFETENKYNNFDLIATNPPWGANFNREEKKLLKKYYPEIKSGETFSYFIKKSLELLKKGGILSFLLPVSFLNVKIHKDIRELIYNNSSIVKIVEYEKIFKNVFTDVIRLDIQKVIEKDNVIEIINEQSQHTINQEEFSNDEDYIFYTKINTQELELIKKIYKKRHFTLKNKARFGLGIVTGNNKKIVHTEKQENDEVIFKGKDIRKFFLKNADNYINFKPSEYQQVASEDIYRAKEKLIYKFISKDLVFAYDNSGRLTLNSANILIPELEDYDIKIVLAFLNSKIFNFLFKKKFNSIKILRSHIESLPFPYLEEKQKKEIIDLVDNVLRNRGVETKLDDYICDIFNLTEKEREII